MTSHYNRIAGQNLERVAALSDGVFAVAMTLLVLDLKAPAAELIHSEQALGHALVSLLPRGVAYLMSFLTLGIFWNGQQLQLNYLQRADRDVTWLHLAFLFVVSLVPFSTALLAEFIAYRTALLIYWGNILLLGVALYLCWQCASGSQLVRKDVPANLERAVRQRIFSAQLLYAIGAALCVINTYWSIAFIVAVQLNYAVAPRLRRLKIDDAASSTRDAQ